MNVGLNMQPRSTRIDHLTLHPMQSTNLLLSSASSSLQQNLKSQQQQQQQSQQHHQQQSQSQQQSSLLNSNNRIYPLSNNIMDCDPPTLSQSTSQQQLRYGQPPQLYRSRYQISSGNSSNDLSSYAPASLPIELSQMTSNIMLQDVLHSGASSMSGGSGDNRGFIGVGNNNSGLGGVVNNSIYQHHIGSGSLVGPMSSILGSSSSSGSVSGGGGVGSSIGSSNYGPYSVSDSISVHQMTPNTKSSSQSNGSNDRDESPMVGVCVGQSPVVIH